MVYPALLSLMRTPRLPVVDLTEAPADLNGLVLFAERRNLVSVRVPSHSNAVYLTETTVYRNYDSRFLTSLATVASSLTPYSLNFSKRFIWGMCQCLFYPRPFYLHIHRIAVL
jgi:hypothetical protein